jgi:hypothetical protein
MKPGREKFMVDLGVLLSEKMAMPARRAKVFLNFCGAKIALSVRVLPGTLRALCSR